MICAGIDAGSRAIKVVLIEAGSGRVLAKAVTDQGVEQNKLALQLYEKLLNDNDINKKDVGKIVATGYGRNLVTIADTTVTEITCHAVGVRRLVPEVKTVVDIGGQDSKLVRLDGSGRVRDFAMNDRCAAGTGRFLEVVSQRLNVDLTDLGDMAGESKEPALISSMCVVFAETEIVGLLAAGKPKEDIIAGVQSAIAGRIASMAAGNVDKPAVFTGGVAMVSGMRSALESALGCAVSVSPEPQFTGALGAAILACDGAD